MNGPGEVDLARSLDGYAEPSPVVVSADRLCIEDRSADPLATTGAAGIVNVLVSKLVLPSWE